MCVLYSVLYEEVLAWNPYRRPKGDPVEFMAAVFAFEGVLGIWMDSIFFNSARVLARLLEIDDSWRVPIPTGTHNNVALCYVTMPDARFVNSNESIVYSQSKTGDPFIKCPLEYRDNKLLTPGKSATLRDAS